MMLVVPETYLSGSLISFFFLSPVSLDGLLLFFFFLVSRAANILPVGTLMSFFACYLRSLPRSVPSLGDHGDCTMPGSRL